MQLRYALVFFRDEASKDMPALFFDDLRNFVQLIERTLWHAAR